MQTQSSIMSEVQFVNRVSQKLTSGQSKCEPIFIAFHKELIFYVTVKMIKDGFFIFKATLCFKNLETVEIPKLYMKTLDDMLKKVRKQNVPLSMMNYYTIQFNRSCQISFQYKFHLFEFKKGEKNFRNSFENVFTDVLTGFRSTFEHLSFCLQNLGILKTQKQNSLIIANMQHNFKQKIMTILKSQTLSEEEKKNYSDAESCMQTETSSSNWKIVDKILQKDVAQEQVSQKFRGGYCQIEKKLCTIYNKENGEMETQSQQKILAVKTLHQSRKEAQQNYHQKLQNQKRILQHIGQAYFLLNYYEQKNNPGVVYMDYCEDTLSRYISRDYGTIDEILSISIEYVKAVSSLHKKGVIHRDLKPSNILLNNNYQQLKIIDFGQSTLVSDELGPESKLGSTVPYSPIQCLSENQSAFNNTALDNWSVGINLYELMFKKLPVSYTRCFSKDILIGWENELMIPLNKLKKRGLRIIEDVFNILTIKLVKFNQQHRLNLQKVLNILQLSQQYIKQVSNFTNC